MYIFVFYSGVFPLPIFHDFAARLQYTYIPHASVNVNHQGPPPQPCRQIQGILTFENFICQIPHPHLYLLCQDLLLFPTPGGENLFILNLPLGVNTIVITPWVGCQCSVCAFSH